VGIENRLREFSKISVDFRKFTEISGNPQGVFCLLKMTALSHFRKFAEIVDMIIFFDLKYSQRDFRNPKDILDQQEWCLITIFKAVCNFSFAICR